MNHADRQRIIHGLQNDVRALERVIALLREVEQDQLDELVKGWGSVPEPLPRGEQQGVGVNALYRRDRVAVGLDAGGTESLLVSCCDTCGRMRPDHEWWCPTRDIEKGVQLPSVPLSKPEADLKERGTGSNPPSRTGGPRGGASSHRKVVE